MEIDGKKIIIRGAGTCSECGKQFYGEPMKTFNDMKLHERLTSHQVWSEEDIVQAALDADPPEERGD